jgi:type II secretory pathway pseudopilin PulG
MLPFTKPLICPSRRNSAGGLGLDSGYALLFVMLAATLILVSLTAVLPSVYQEGQREREQELIFRGTQYARAIANFHQKFQRFPTSVNELTKLTNGFRFLRKEYADPMTPSGKWRFIHANSQGVLLDSKTQGPASGGQGQPGTGQGTGGFGMSGPSSMGGSAFGQSGMGGSGFGQADAGGSAFGQQGMGGGGMGQSTGGFSLDSNSGGSTSGSQWTSAFSGAGNQGGGTYIVGVASTSLKKSIRIWNQKTHYDEWEFIGVDLGALGLATSITGLPQGAGGQSGQGDQPNTFGQPSQGNPTTPGQNQGLFSP